MAFRTYSRIYKDRVPPSPKSLEALADKMSGVVQLSFTKGIKTWGSKANRAIVERAVRSGDYKNVIKEVPWDKLSAVLAGMEGDLVGVAVSGGAFGANEVAAGLGGRGSTLPKAPGGKTINQQELARSLSLTVKNPAIKEYVGTRIGELVQNVTDNLQATIQRAVSASSKTYGTPRQIADRLIDQNLPLNDRQSVALERYSATVREAYGDTKAANIIIGRYADQLQDQRAMAIGRTETSFAANFGQQAVWQNARDEGLLPEGAKRVWVTEANPCDLCLLLNGVEVGIDEPWVTSDGEEIDSPPYHTNCLCLVALGGL